MVDVQPLRREARRNMVVRLRYWLGGRPLLHRLWPADSWRDLDHVRGQAGRHAGRRRVLAGDLAARRGRVVHRADRVPRDQEGRPERRVAAQIRSLEIPHAVPRRRARRSADGGMGRAAAESARDRSLVADRDRLVRCRQSDRAWAIAGQARFADGADAGLPGRRGRRGGKAGQAEHDGLDRDQAADAAGLSADAVAAGRSASRKRISPNSPATTKPPTPVTRTRTATSG